MYQFPDGSIKPHLRNQAVFKLYWQAVDARTWTPPAPRGALRRAVAARAATRALTQPCATPRAAVVVSKVSAAKRAQRNATQRARRAAKRVKHDEPSSGARCHSSRTR